LKTGWNVGKPALEYRGRDSSAGGNFGGEGGRRNCGWVRIEGRSRRGGGRAGRGSAL